MRRKPVQRFRSLLIVAVLVLGSIWAAGEFARAGSGPEWMQFLFGALGPTGGLRAGIVAGHQGNDPGTVCADGLTEASVNLDVAERVAKGLRSQGIRAEVLDEFDRRLRGYRADVFVSIHADSCQARLTGFKVSAPEGGGEPSQRLSTCLWDSYEEATSLPPHPGTITRDMTSYHAFSEIAQQTPAAIIEIGFLGTDRQLLTEHPDRVAQGIVGGILCFLIPSE